MASTNSSRQGVRPQLNVLGKRGIELSDVEMLFKNSLAPNTQSNGATDTAVREFKVTLRAKDTKTNPDTDRATDTDTEKMKIKVRVLVKDKTINLKDLNQNAKIEN